MNISVEEMAKNYWRRMHRSALREIEQRLTQLKTASPETIRYWLGVHAWLEKKSNLVGQKIQGLQTEGKN